MIRSGLGASQQAIVRGKPPHQFPLPLGAPSWSPDGSTLAFTGVIGPPRNGLPSVKIFLVAADSSELHAVPGANGGYEPIFSPDGHTLAFSRIRQDRRKTQHGGEDIVYESATAWLANLAGGGMRRLTSWRNHLFNFASSFSPDGSVGAIAQDR